MVGLLKEERSRMKNTPGPMSRCTLAKRFLRVALPHVPFGLGNAIAVAVLPAAVLALSLELLFSLGAFGELPLNLRATKLCAHTSYWPVWLAPDVIAVDQQLHSVGEPSKELWDGETVVARRIGTGYGQAEEAPLLFSHNNYDSQLAFAFFSDSALDSLSPDGQWRLNLRGLAIGRPQLCLYRLRNGGRPLPNRFDEIEPVTTMLLPEFSPCGFGGPPTTTVPTFAWKRDATVWAMLCGVRREGFDDPLFYRWHLSFFRPGQSRPEQVVDLSSVADKPFEELRLLGFTDAGNPVIYRWYLSQAPGNLIKVSGDLIEIALAHDAIGGRHHRGGAGAGKVRILKTVVADLPAEVSGEEVARGPVAVSTAGDRLAWTVHLRRHPWHLPRHLAQGIESVRPLAALWHRWIAEREIREIWTSHIDGTGMQRMGWLPATEYDRKPFAFGIGGIVAWSPDGRQLLFDYDGDIYAYGLTASH
jgi:hypothetical protein